MTQNIRILKWIFGFIHFVKYLRSYLHKNLNRGSDKYEIWCVEQLGRAEKKAQNSFFVRPAVHGANILQIFFTTFSSDKYLAMVLLPRSTGPQIFVTSCLFSDWIATGSIVKGLTLVQLLGAGWRHFFLKSDHTVACSLGASGEKVWANSKIRLF